MIWKSKNGMYVEMTKDVFASIMKHVSSRKEGETGGILIGNYSEDLSTATILSASGPGPRSLLGLLSFTRRPIGLQAELDEEFISGKYYLGEWHCHPGTNCAPSFQDIHQMQAISRSPNYNCPEPILLVFGRSNPHDFNSASIIKGNRVVKLERVNSE